MGDQKVTIMVIKVDLQCQKCYTKIKKILCKIPREEIRDQVYDDKNNTVTIRVVCCSPEKVKQKICCNGGKIIQGIQIVEPPKPKPPAEKSKDPEKKPEKPKTPEKKPEKLEQKPEKVKEPEKKPDKLNEVPIPIPIAVSVPALPPAPAPQPEPVAQERIPVYFPPPVPAPQERIPIYFPPPPTQGLDPFCAEYWQGTPGGPCCYGEPPQSYSKYDPSINGRPVYDSWGGSYSAYNSKRCGDCFSDDNPSGCSIM
ncbi:hypothetical protein ACFE04_000227 [Oxalis oulophora]